MTSTTTTTMNERPLNVDAPRSVRGDQAYQSTLRYLQRVAGERQHVSPPAPPSGPEWVRDVMTTSVVAAHEDAVFKEIVASLAHNHVSAVPVIDADRRVVGIVSEADLLAHLTHVTPRPPRGHVLASRAEHAGKLHGATAAQLMTSPAVVVEPGMSIVSAAWLAARTRVKRLPVIDENGELVGIVSRGDLLRAYLRSDDEIKADIVENVLHGAYILDRDQVHVDVDEGVVTLRGHLPIKTMVADVVATTRNVVGVIEVDASALTYRID